MRLVSEQPSLASQTIAGATASTGMAAFPSASAVRDPASCTRLTAPRSTAHGHYELQRGYRGPPGAAHRVIIVVDGRWARRGGSYIGVVWQSVDGMRKLSRPSHPGRF